MISLVWLTGRSFASVPGIGFPGDATKHDTIGTSGLVCEYSSYMHLQHEVKQHNLSRNPVWSHIHGIRLYASGFIHNSSFGHSTLVMIGAPPFFKKRGGGALGIPLATHFLFRLYACVFFLPLWRLSAIAGKSFPDFDKTPRSLSAL